MTDGTKAGIGVGVIVGILGVVAIVVWILICTQSRIPNFERRDKQRAKGTYEMEV